MITTADDTLHMLLMAITEDVARRAGAAADAIRGMFALRIEDAGRHAPWHERAAIVQSLMNSRDSALAAAASTAAQEAYGRQQVAIAAHASQQQPGRGQAEDSVADDAAPIGAMRAVTTKAGSGVSVGRMFSEAKAMTRRAVNAPTLRPRRRVGGETARALRPAARAVLRRASRVPAAAFGAELFLAETLDWLNLWDVADNDGMAANEHLPISNHLSPHP